MTYYQWPLKIMFLKNVKWLKVRLNKKTKGKNENSKLHTEHDSNCVAYVHTILKRALEGNALIH